MGTMTDARALEILGDLCAGQWENVAEPALQHLASRLRGDAAPALRTDYVLEFITETPEDVTHKKLVELGWTPPAAPAPVAGGDELIKREINREFVEAVKRLCRDYSCRQNRPYMADVFAQLDFLHEQLGVTVVENTPVAGDAVAVVAQRLIETLSADAFVKPSGKNANAGFVDMRDWYAMQGEVAALSAALAQDRASQAGSPVGVPDGYALVPTHWRESLLASAGLLEAAKCPIDSLQAKALRKMAGRIAAAPTPAADREPGDASSASGR